MGWLHGFSIGLVVGALLNDDRLAPYAFAAGQFTRKLFVD